MSVPAPSAPGELRSDRKLVVAWPYVSALLLVTMVAIIAAVIVWRAIPRFPADDSVAAGFARDMAIHHAQAVDMGFIALDRISDPTIRIIAADIVQTQQAQIGIMQGWLDVWGLSMTGQNPPMSWMGHDGHEGMPGMASREDIERLSTLPPDQARDEFLRLMIHHHQGGATMAEAALARTDLPEVRRLAAAIATAQTAEIERMQELLS